MRRVRLVVSAQPLDPAADDVLLVDGKPATIPPPGPTRSSVAETLSQTADGRTQSVEIAVVVERPTVADVTHALTTQMHVAADAAGLRLDRREAEKTARKLVSRTIGWRRFFS